MIMKDQKKWLAMCLFFAACSSRPDQADTSSHNNIVAQEIAMIENRSEAKSEESAGKMAIHFSPPVIKDNEADYEQFDENGNPYLGPQKIIKTAYMTIRVDSAETAKVYIDSLVKKFKCRYDNEGFENNWDRKTLKLQIRIPTADFASFINELEKGSGSLESKQISEEDVTANYVDLESRLKTKRQFIDRYHELLKKATTVKSMLEIEENLRGLQEEIDVHESRLKLLGSQISYSTLNLDVYKLKEMIAKPVELPGFFSRVRNSLVEGLNSILDSIYWIVQIWPLLLLILWGTFITRRFFKRKKTTVAAS
jgi:hypothetical protein